MRDGIAEVSKNTRRLNEPRKLNGGNTRRRSAMTEWFHSSRYNRRLYLILVHQHRHYRLPWLILISSGLAEFWKL